MDVEETSVDTGFGGLGTVAWCFLCGKRLAELREEVTTKHRRTTRLLQAGELPPSDPTTAAVPNEEKHSRKSKHTPRAELPEEKFTVEITPAEEEVEIPSEVVTEKRGRGRPSSKKKSTVAQEIEDEADELLQNMEALHAEGEGKGKKVPPASAKKAKKEKPEEDDDELDIEDEVMEDDGDFLADSDDPDFVPVEEDCEIISSKDKVL
ncbi:hypothetical protein B566_EDAN012859 [Ephemera danica]|nr:hypothetical protein B566_EDAN012859 [Ephemera danica]